jgi:hypothetical protein
MYKYSDIQNLIDSIKSQKLANSYMDQDVSEVPEEVRDSIIALKISPSLIACSHFTSSKMINPNPSYQFANNPGVNSCSNPLLLESSPKNTLVQCPYSPIQSSCAYYSPNYQILKKVSNNNIFYYLTKFKSLEDHYFYAIYDSNMNLYFNLSYNELVDNNLDQDAYAAFDNFINDLMITVFEVDLYSFQDQEKLEKKSYLSTIFS